MVGYIMPAVGVPLKMVSSVISNDLSEKYEIITELKAVLEKTFRNISFSADQFLK